jgi:hypothetical protein
VEDLRLQADLLQRARELRFVSPSCDDALHIATTRSILAGCGSGIKELLEEANFEIGADSQVIVHANDRSSAEKLHDAYLNAISKNGDWRKLPEVVHFTLLNIQPFRLSVSYTSASNASEDFSEEAIANSTPNNPPQPLPKTTPITPSCKDEEIIALVQGECDFPASILSLRNNRILYINKKVLETYSHLTLDTTIGKDIKPLFDPKPNSKHQPDDLKVFHAKLWERYQDGDYKLREDTLRAYQSSGMFSITSGKFCARLIWGCPVRVSFFSGLELISG